MKTNKQLTPKQKTIYIYKSIVKGEIRLEIYGRLKKNTFGIAINKTKDYEQKYWNWLKNWQIMGICNSLYLLDKYGINTGRKQIARRINSGFLIKNNIILPKNNIYPIIYK